MIIDLLKGILSIPVPFNMIVLIVLFGCTVGAITAVAHEIRRYFCHRQDVDFKRELVDRGLGCEEIERIIAARAPNDDKPVAVGGDRYVGGKPAKA